MEIQSTHLRMYRKRSPLLQSDIAYILGLKEYSSISRWESGERPPSVDMLLLYHLLFGMPVGTLFEEKTLWETDIAIERIQFLIEILKPVAVDRKIAKRMSFLVSALGRLTNKAANE